MRTITTLLTLTLVLSNVARPAAWAAENRFGTLPSVVGSATLPTQWTPTPAATMVPDPQLGGAASGTGADAIAPADVVGESPLSLDELRQIALDNNPTIVQARMLVQSAMGQQIQAGLYFNPQVSWAGADIGMDQTSGQQGGYVAQEFITAHKRRLARNVASHAVVAAEQTLAAQRERVMNDVKWRFYEVLIAQQMVRVNADLVEVGTTAETTTARLRTVQEVSEADVQQATIEAERARLSLFQAHNRQRTAWYQLTAVAGVPGMGLRPLAGDVVRDLPLIDWEDGLVRILAFSPELAQARARVEQARCNVALQQARRHPNVTLQVGVKYDESVRDTLTDASLSMPLQIFDRNQGNIITARAELAAAMREVQRVELDLRNRFAAAFEGYSNSQQQVHVFRSTILSKAQGSLELTGIGYRAGEYGYLQLLTAQRTYFAANLEYLASLQALWAQAITLDGFLLSGGLDSVE